MLETPEKIVKGAQIIGRILGVKRIIIAIELNKPDAIETMTKAAEAIPIAFFACLGSCRCMMPFSSISNMAIYLPPMIAA